MTWVRTTRVATRWPVSAAMRWLWGYGVWLLGPAGRRGRVPPATRMV